MKPKVTANASDEFDVRPSKAAPTESKTESQMPAAPPKAKLVLPKPGPPPPRIEKIGGTDPRADDDGNFVTEFKGELPDDLAGLIALATELDNQNPILKNRKAELQRRARLVAVKRKLFLVQQSPTAPYAVLQTGPSPDRIRSLAEKLAK